jgi:putative ABC transport system ATP-binding protein
MNENKIENILIKVQNISKTFDQGKVKVHALKDVTLDIFQGEYLSIMGPSGSGKSTLFNMIGALDHPSDGYIEIGNIRLNTLSSRQLAYFRGNYIGYVFQNYNLLPAYDAVTNVCMPLLFSGMSYPQAVERAKEVLSRVGLSHRFSHRPDELSGGQQQRVAIARALANNPIIILADEPTANLDLNTGEEIINLLSELSKEFGVTVITSTHDHKMLAKSDRILWIKDGMADRLEYRKDLNIQVGSVE